MKVISSVMIGFISLSISTTTLGGTFTDQVKRQLEAIKQISANDGWEETHNDKLDKLNNGGNDSFSFTLRKGTKYKIVSVCDNHCKDIDLILYDENNNEVSRDTSTDSLPIIDVNPRWSGKFSLKVKMASCTNNPCYYGISILGK